MMTFNRLIAAIAILAPQPVLAWGDDGHRIVALIAQTMLTQETAIAVRGILASDVDSMTDTDFASRATWADAYRDHDPSTASWHFINLELAHIDMNAACHARRGKSCIVDKINEYTGVLARPAATPAERAFALKMVLHLVGDVHQPLHTADSRDAGGNCERVTYGGGHWYSKPTEVSLHGYWDTDAVKQLGNDPATIAATLRRRITITQAHAWSRGSAAQWALESHELALNVAYRFGGHPDCVGGITALSDAYQVVARRTVEIQLSRAGVRLAGILNGTVGRQ